MKLHEYTTEQLTAEISRRVRNPVVIKAINHAADAYGIDALDILARNRKKNPSIARQAAVYLARNHTDLGLVELATAFNRGDHGTIAHSLRAARGMLDTCPRFRKVVETFRTDDQV